MAAEVESKPVAGSEAAAKKEEQETPPAVAAAAADTTKGDDAAKPAAAGDESSAAAAKEKEAAAAKEPPPPKVTVHKPNFEKDVVYLYQFSRTPQLPSLSPYCLKVETWLRLADVKYENVDHKMKYRSKKGQLPFVELNGDEISDSGIILRELSARFGRDLDAQLGQEQRNVSHATTSMIENHLNWVTMWWRSKHPDQMLRGYKVNLQHVLGSRLPNGVLNFCFKFAFGRKWFQGAKKVKAQGMGVHTAEEVNNFGQNDLKVLSNMLGERPYFFGDDPTNLDVVAFAHLAQIHFIDKEVDYPLREFMAEQCPNLVAHVDRMRARCFPDWEEMCTNLDMNPHLPKPEKKPDAGEESKKEEGEEGEKKEEHARDEKEGKEPEDKDTGKEKKTEEAAKDNKAEEKKDEKK